MKVLQSFVLVAVFSCSLAAPTLREYESNIIFYRFKDSNEERFISQSNITISEEGCDPAGNFSMIVHGWTEGISTEWVNKTIRQLLTHRGGCVFFMDYSKYANVSDYFNLVSHFEGISAVLTQKFKQIENYDRQYCFGFSFGSRLCVDAGIAIGNQSIARMDICDPAGPGFDGSHRAKDPKLGAKNVACINTSNDKGTSHYNCHQNFRMGVCGHWQIANGPRPLGSHGLCPYFYNISFDYKFEPNNYFNCWSELGRMANLTSSADIRMGYLGTFNRTLVRGEIFVATARFPPYVVINNVIENSPQTLTAFENEV